MKVLMFSCAYPPQGGGIGVACKGQAEALLKGKHAREVEEVVVLTLKSGNGGGLKLEKSEQKSTSLAGLVSEPKIIREKNFFRWGNAGFLKEIDALVKNADVVHLHYPFFGIHFKILRLCRKFSKPLVITYHMDVLGRGFSKPFFWIYGKIITPFILSKADAVIFAYLDYGRSSFAKKIIKRHPDKIFELPFGIPEEMFGARQKELALHPKKPGARATFGFLSVLDRAHRFKGLEYLLEACKKIKDSHADFLLYIAGGGDMKNYYENLAKLMGLEKNVEFTGQLQEFQKKDFFSTLDCFVLPSIDRSEAFGIVLIEAFALGIKVIASDLPGVRDVVKKCNRGILVRPKDSKELARAMFDIIQKQPGTAECGGQSGQIRERARLIQCARENFSQDKCAQKIISVYKACLCNKQTALTAANMMAAKKGR